MRHFFARPALSFGAAFSFLALVSVRSLSAGDVTNTEGCMNQWLFNGIWRVQATKVEPMMDGAQQVGWQVTEVWRNGTSSAGIAPGDTFAKPQQLELGDGTKLSTDDTSTAHMSQSQIDTHAFGASSQFTYVQIFRPQQGLPDPANKPKAFDISFDNSKLSQSRVRPHFSTTRYDYRIKLDCTASTTTASAQGGSSQIAGKEGCMNQWMSNGLWRMRSTGVAPDNDLGGTQVGWKIAEEWTSLAPRPLAPGDSYIIGQQLALTGGNTMSSGDGVVSSGSFGQLAGHSFSPGGAFTYEQQFRQIPLDATDKPTKLIVSFDAAKQNARAGMPHYTLKPANFRISFTCSK